MSRVRCPTHFSHRPSRSRFVRRCHPSSLDATSYRCIDVSMRDACRAGRCHRRSPGSLLAISSPADELRTVAVPVLAFYFRGKLQNAPHRRGPFMGRVPQQHTEGSHRGRELEILRSGRIGIPRGAGRQRIAEQAARVFMGRFIAKFQRQQLGTLRGRRGLPGLLVFEGIDRSGPAGCSAAVSSTTTTTSTGTQESAS